MYWQNHQFSFFNILGLFFYIPFAVVLMKEGYAISGALGWLFAMILMIQSANFLNFLINKNTHCFRCNFSCFGIFNWFTEFWYL